MQELRALDDVCHLVKTTCSTIRLEILYELARAPLCVGALASRLELDRRHVSMHLGVLSKAGLVTAEEEGTRRRYSLTRYVAVHDEGAERQWRLTSTGGVSVSIALRRFDESGSSSDGEAPSQTDQTPQGAHRPR